MKKLRVITVVGTRPEIIRLSRVIAELEKNCDHILVHTGQNHDYELSQIFFDELEIKKPDFFLKSAEDSKSVANTIGNMITSCDVIFSKVKPEALLILGDTNSCLAVIPAKRRKIPIFHMEAGNRCFDQRVPEEINRRIIDHTADINLTYSDIAREYLLREGLPSDQIIKTGSPMFEVLHYYLPLIKKSKILPHFGLVKDKFFVVSAHREENIESEKNFKKLVDFLNTISEEYKLPILVSTHPRTRKKIEETKTSFNKLIQLLKPVGFIDYVKLQTEAKVVLSDSGTINEEASILNFPALNIREAHERPEGMEEAAVMMTGLDKNRIMQCIEILDKETQQSQKCERIVKDYIVPNVSQKVVKIIHSYTDYVNRVVWKKY